MIYNNEFSTVQLGDLQRSFLRRKSSTINFLHLRDLQRSTLVQLFGCFVIDDRVSKPNCTRPINDVSLGDLQHLGVSVADGRIRHSINSNSSPTVKLFNILEAPSQISEQKTHACIIAAFVATSLLGDATFWRLRPR